MKFTTRMDFRIFLTRKFFWSLKQKEVIEWALNYLTYCNGNKSCPFLSLRVLLLTLGASGNLEFLPSNMKSWLFLPLPPQGSLSSVSGPSAGRGSVSPGALSDCLRSFPSPSCLISVPRLWLNYMKCQSCLIKESGIFLFLTEQYNEKNQGCDFNKCPPFLHIRIEIPLSLGI